MKSYFLTLEDLAYLVQSEPDKFSDPDAALESIRDAVQHGYDTKTGESAEAIRIRLQQEYLRKDGEYLSQSPIPGLAEDDDCKEPHDGEFSSAACDCGSETPCCFQEGSIIDREPQSGRMLKWPIKEGDPTTLLVVATDNGNVTRHDGVDVDSGVIGRIDVNVTGENCKKNKPNMPALESYSYFYGSSIEPISEYDRTKYIAVPYFTDDRLKGFYQNPFIDSKVIMTFYVFSGIVSLISQKYTDNAQKFTYTPKQCVNNVCLYPTFTVIPVPYFSLNGSANVTFSLVINTTRGVELKTEGSYGMDCTYGKYKVEYKNKPTDTTKPLNKKAKKFHEENGDWPALLGTLKDVFSSGSALIGGYEVKKKELIIEEYGSQLKFFVSLGVNANAISLRPKQGTPDLTVDMGGLEAGITVGAELRIDVIEAFVRAFAPVGGGKLLEARTRMAQGIKVKKKQEGKYDQDEMEAGLSAILVANIIGVGDGEFLWQLGDKNQAKLMQITIPAEGDYDFDFNTKVFERRRAKILAKGEFKAQLDAECWIFSASMGFEGSIHTSLQWEWKKGPDGIWYRRFYFEGITVAYKKYLVITKKDKNGGAVSAESTYGGNGDFKREQASDQDLEKHGPEVELTTEEKMEQLKSVYEEYELEKVGVTLENCERSTIEEIACKTEAEIYDKYVELCAPSVRNKNESNPPWEKC
jgi:hypothetical protein